MIDSTGTTAAFWRRNAYGQNLASGGTPINSWGFHGTYLDATGLNKMGARYYDPATGAFTQVEPFKDTTALRGIIDYTYAGADPINQMDPMGLCPTGVWDGFCTAASTLRTRVNNANHYTYQNMARSESGLQPRG